MTKTQSVAAFFAAALLGVAMLFATAVPAGAATVDDLEAQIAALLAQLSALEGDDEVTVTSNGYIHHPNVDYMFNTNLYLGSRGTDVMMLQRALNDGGYTVATSGAGSAGNETTYFGPATLRAVQAFQSANGISPAAGYFYPLTRAEFNKKATVVVDVDDEDDNSGDAELEVSEGDRISDDFFAEGQILMPVTSFTLEASDEDVRVRGVTVRFDGRADSDVVDSVVLLDEEGNIMGEEDSFDSDDEAELDVDFTVEEGEEMMFWVAVNADEGSTKSNPTIFDDVFDGDDGDEFMVEVIEIDTDADVDGLPISGAEHEVTDNDLGDVKAEVVNEGGNIEIGEDEELIATIEINPNPDDNDDSVYVMMLRIENTGSADLSDLDNIYLDADGDDIEGMVMDNDYIVFNFGSNGFEIEEGDDEDFEIYADIVDGENSDTFTFDFENSFDVYVVDEDGYGLPHDRTAASGGSTTVESGDIDLNDDDTVEDDEVSIGDDVEIGSFTLEIEGEEIETDEIIVTVIGTSTAAMDDDYLLEDLYIEDEDGNVVFDADDAEYTTGTSASSTRTMTVTWDNEDLSVMDETVMIVKATIQDDVVNGTTYQISSVEFKDMEGAQSGDDITDVSETDFPLRTVEAANVIVSVSSSPKAQNIAEDTDQIHFASYRFDLGDSGENVELNEFDITLLVSDANTQEDLNDCRVYVDDVEVELDDEIEFDDAAAGTSTETVRFDESFELEKDETTIFDLKCDISSSDNDNKFTFGLRTAASSPFDANAGSADTNGYVELDGVTTDNSVEATFGSKVTGQTMTVANATLTVDEDSTSPSTRLVVAGSEVVLGVLELEAEDGDITVDEITATLDGESIALVNEMVEIYVDGDKVGEMTFNGTDDSDEIDGLSIDVEDDETVLVEFRAEISSTDDDEDGADGAEVQLEIDEIDTLRNSVTVSGDDFDFDTVYTYATVPTLAEVSFTEDELEDGENTVLIFSVTADDADEVTVASTTLTVTNPGAATVNTAKVEVFTNSSLSNKVTVGSLNKFQTSPAASSTSFTTVIGYEDGGDYLEVSAGETYYFKVTLDVTGSADGDSLGVELAEDSSPGSTGNFLWSTPDGQDSSTFFNGFEVEGGDSDIKNTIDRD